MSKEKLNETERIIRGFKKPLMILVLVLLIVGGLFFWYEYRPSMIRARCSIEAEKMANKNEYVYEIIYRHCLRSHGIEYSEQKEKI